MKKMMKRIMASILAIAMCVSAYIAFDGNVAEASQDTLTSSDFKMVGASIRFEDDNTTVNGIRFGIGIKESVYSELDANVKNSIRLLVMPTKLVTGDLEIGETYTKGTVSASAIDTAIGTKWDLKTYADGNYYVTYVYLYDIDNTCYDFDVTARAYWRADENSTPVYTDAIDRSYIYVAEAALNDVATDSKGVYTNEVEGATVGKFSPYTADQRNALIGVPYEMTANTRWDYVDGALVKDDLNDGDCVLYDRRIDASKDFTVKFTHKVEPLQDTRKQRRLINFAEGQNQLGQNQLLEIDYVQTDSNSDGIDDMFQLHLRACVDGHWKYIGNNGNNTAHYLQPETEYDFILMVSYGTSTVRVDLDVRPHDTPKTLNVIERQLTYSFTADDNVACTFDPDAGVKFGYVGHSSTRKATFENANNKYMSNRYKKDGALMDSATNAVITEGINQLQVSGYTTNGSEAYVPMPGMLTYSTMKGNFCAEFTLTVDIKFDNYVAGQSFAGLKLGHNSNYRNGQASRIRLHSTKIASDGTTFASLNATTMGEEAYNTYISNIENGIANELKIQCYTIGTNQYAIFWVNGVLVAEKADIQDMHQNRVVFTTNTNATFSNIKIGTNSYPVKATAKDNAALQAGVVVEEVSNKLQISGYTAQGSDTYCTLLNKVAYDKSIYQNNNANFTLSMDVEFDKFTDNSFAGFTVGYHNLNQNGAHTHIRMTAAGIGSDTEPTKYVQLNETTMPDGAYATYLSNIDNGIANSLKVVFVTKDGTTTMTFSVNGVNVGSYDIAAGSIYENRIALTTNTNATFSNLVIE